MKVARLQVCATARHFRFSKQVRRFPSDFAELLTPLGLRVLRGAAPRWRSIFSSAKTPFTLMRGMIDRDKARACMRLLDRRIYPLLALESVPIPSDSISGMLENYSESLRKILRFKTAFLTRRTAIPYQVAEALGLLAMMRSESLAVFAEVVTGLRLLRPPTSQIICYGNGDYVGPHNDHHPEDDASRHGFVDVHLTFSNDAVAHQFLVYERNRHLSQIVDVSRPGGISVYRLPFWHYTTPLVGRPGREQEARRWLLLATFNLPREERARA